MIPTLDLTGRPCLLVGGAGGGIGTAVARAVAASGATVGIVTNVDEHAAIITEDLRSVGAEVVAVVADVTDEDQLVRSVRSVCDELGPIRHLVNIVGGNAADDYQRAAEIDMTAFDRVLARNLRYAVVACREVAAPLLAAGATGSIVNVSSAASRGTPLLGPYAAAKSGLEAYSRTAALEWAPSGIRVNVVSVGTVRTPRTGMGRDDAMGQSIPLRRRGDPEEVAAAALFLLSDLASYITGQTLVVDGGVTLGHPGGATLSAFATRPEVRARFGEPEDGS
jgi:NAD(P)-dependent dehydrogenase (short-subunit alcohol dehydrogenase family)